MIAGRPRPVRSCPARTGLLAVCALILLSAGCGISATDAPAAGAFTPYVIHTKDGAGKLVTRSFRFYRPSGLANSSSHKVPLVVTFANNQDWVSQANAGRFVLINLPNLHKVNGRCCQYAIPTIANATVGGARDCGSSGTQACDDIPWIRAVVKDMETCSKTHGLTLPCQNIDPRRVFATGGSKGGSTSEDVICDARTSQLFTAVAPISALLVSHHSSTARASDPSTWPRCPKMLGVDPRTGKQVPRNLSASVLWIYGDHDNFFTSRSCSTRCLATGFKSRQGLWSWGDDQMISSLLSGPRGCPKKPSVTTTLPQTSGQVVRHDYLPCAPGRGTFSTIEVRNGGHIPEGSSADGVKFAPIIWRFFVAAAARLP